MTVRAIFDRASVRQFTDDAVSDRQVEGMLRAAMAAPSACNQQPWEFYVVRDRETLERLAKATPYAAPTGRAACCIVPCMRTSGLTAPECAQQDMGACVENLLLAAADLGLGACWQAVYPSRDRVDNVRAALGAPDGLDPFCLVAVGVPATDPIPSGVKRYDETRVHRVG